MDVDLTGLSNLFIFNSNHHKSHFLKKGYLVASYKKPDRLIQIEGSGGSAMHLHADK